MPQKTGSEKKKCKSCRGENIKNFDSAAFYKKSLFILKYANQKSKKPNPERINGKN